ncbi:hypothetical protein PHLGIDRAFT_78047, partial [Phlebiopsis gigantea 11061_1 CR5-6]
IGPFRTSPLGLVPKPHSTKLRLVQDMSFPRRRPGVLSVNATIDSDDFPTAWGTFADTSALLLTLPPGCMAATFDIRAAYRVTPIRPAQQNALCLCWNGKIYVDRAVMFGLSSSAGVFGSVADMLVAIYEACGFFPVLKWVDDFLVIRRPGEAWSEQDFVQLTSPLGVPWADEKTRPFAVQQQYIGFVWDLEAKTVSFPEHKLLATNALISSWRDPLARFDAHEAASLHGKLVHTSTIFRLIRPFLRSASHFATSFRNPTARLRPPRPLLHDLSWIASMLSVLPRTLPLQHAAPHDLGWWGDASTSFGIGVVVGAFWGVWAWAPGFEVGPGCRHDIGWAEAVAVELGLALVAHHQLLDACLPSQRHLLVRSDNSGVVAVVNSGRSRNQNTNQVLKRVFLRCASLGISLHTEYVPSRDNVTDPLSRGDISSFLLHFPSAKVRSEWVLPPHLRSCLIPWSG